jgi:hypothetical protein
MNVWRERNAHIYIYTNARTLVRLTNVNSSTLRKEDEKKKKKTKTVCVLGLLMRRIDNGNETHQVFASNNGRYEKQTDRQQKKRRRISMSKKK